MDFAGELAKRAAPNAGDKRRVQHVAAGPAGGKSPNASASLSRSDKRALWITGGVIALIIVELASGVNVIAALLSPLVVVFFVAWGKQGFTKREREINRGAELTKIRKELEKKKDG